MILDLQILLWVIQRDEESSRQHRSRGVSARNCPSHSSFEVNCRPSIHKPQQRQSMLLPSSNPAVDMAVHGQTYPSVELNRLVSCLSTEQLICYPNMEMTAGYGAVSHLGTYRLRKGRIPGHSELELKRRPPCQR